MTLSTVNETIDNTPSMMPPSTPTSKRGGPVGAAMQMSFGQQRERAPTGGGGGGGGMDPAKEKILFSRLEEITTKLNSIASGNISSGGPSPLSRVSGPDIFSDDRNKDNQFKIEGTLKESNVTKLSDHEQQRLSFGIEILKIFGMDRGSRKVTLSIASSLPSNGSALNNNAYGNSFHWNSESRILYVREERLESVGEFAMLLVHTLAHISADPKGMKGTLGKEFEKMYYFCNFCVLCIFFFLTFFLLFSSLFLLFSFSLSLI